MTHEDLANRWALLRQALIQDRLADVQAMLAQHGLPAATPSSDPLTHRALTLLAGAPDAPDLDEPCYRVPPALRAGASLPFTTVLHWALEGSRPNLVTWLIGNGASVSTLDSKGRTPWDLVDQELRLRQHDLPSPFQHHARTITAAVSLVRPTPSPARPVTAPSVVPRVSAVPVTRRPRIDAPTVAAFQTALVRREQALLAVSADTVPEPSPRPPSATTAPDSALPVPIVPRKRL